jgi:UDP-N-acetylglucosamine 2-epimerase
MPEEINRVVADHTADLLFAPTPEAVKHLEREGLKERTVMTGDIMADTFEYVHNNILGDHVPDTEYYLLTLHRPYTVDDPEKLQKLLNMLSELDREIMFPVHPRTKSVIDKNNIEVPRRIKLSPPQGYLEFQKLLKGCEKVITDSGGLQKEAYLAGKPCITIRPETEWVETVEAGWNILMDADDVNVAGRIMDFTPKKERPDLYGKNVAKRMVEEMVRWHLAR